MSACWISAPRKSSIGRWGRCLPPKKKWSYNIISPDETFEECYGRKADRRRKLYNGMIKCQFYMYYKAGFSRWTASPLRQKRLVAEAEMQEEGWKFQGECAERLL